MKTPKPQDRIRKIMQKKNLTQQHLSELLEISQPALSNYLKGRMPPADVLYQIARLDNTTVEWLLTGRKLEQTTSVHESQPAYGNEYLMLKFWRKLPAKIQKDLLVLVNHLIESVVSEKKMKEN
jgi:transcriptional regulator with XRE-family HTH domain